MSMTADASEATAERRDFTVRSATDNLARPLQFICWLVAVALGLLHAWVSRHAMQSDGISYLDMGEAYLRGDWAMAVNGYWSPLYSWLLGAALAVLRPSAYWEFPVAHLVNFVVYVAALVGFSFLLGEVIRYGREVSGRERAENDVEWGGVESDGATARWHGWATLPQWAMVVVGYVLFLWSALELITLRSVTPDMVVAAVVYAASGLVARVRRGAGGWVDGWLSGWRVYAMLGLVLGVGYLAKAAMFPLAFVFLAVSVLAAGDVKKGARGAAVGLVVFLLVGAPFIIALSVAKGRVTFGDTGRLNYAWYVNGVGYRHWQGGPAGSGEARHTTRRVVEEPAVYEFGGPVGGTYPAWYDPSYWNEGLTPRFHLGQHVKNMLVRPGLYALLLFALQGSLAIGLFILFYMSGRGRRAARDVAANWFLLVPALAAFAMYMQVYVETRFLGSFFTLLFVGLFSSVRLPDAPESRRLVACVMVIVIAMFCLTVGPSNARAAYAAARDITGRGEAAPNEYWQIAEELKRMGLRPGDKVASLNYSNNGNVYWSRLAKVQIVAEMFSNAFRKDEDDFWTADGAVRARVIETFAKAGANVVVANAAPSWATEEGWRRIGDTDYYVYFLPRPATALVLTGPRRSLQIESFTRKVPSLVTLS